MTSFTVRPDKKFCTFCKQLKSLSEFYRRSTGYQSQCKICQTIRRRHFSNAPHNKKSQRDRKLKSFGLSVDAVEAISAALGHRCQICGSRPKKLHVDHCHVTNKFRGLLCRLCNLGLGHFGDDVTRLRCAILYLLEFQGENDDPSSRT
jgi:hypothetical protein